MVVSSVVIRDLLSGFVSVYNPQGWNDCTGMTLCCGKVGIMSKWRNFWCGRGQSVITFEQEEDGLDDKEI